MRDRVGIRFVAEKGGLGAKDRPGRRKRDSFHCGARSVRS